MAKIKITNLVKFYTVLLLHEKPRHGYELIHCIGEKLEETISPGQMYPFLKKLQKNKLITVKKSGKRDKKVYALTKEGKSFTRKMLEKSGNLIALAVGLKLTTCAHCGCKTYGPGHKEKIKGKKMNFCCKHCAASFKHCKDTSK